MTWLYPSFGHGQKKPGQGMGVGVTGVQAVTQRMGVLLIGNYWNNTNGEIVISNHGCYPGNYYRYNP